MQKLGSLLLGVTFLACPRPATPVDAGTPTPLIDAGSRRDSLTAAPVARDAGPFDGVRFVAVGDTGKHNTNQQLVGEAIGTLCAQRGCDFVILLGDNIYPSGAASVTDPLWETAFVRPYATVDAPFYAVLGNHDNGGNGAGNELERGDVQVAYSKVNPKWRMPAVHYRFTQGPAEFFALDTNRTYWNLDEQARKDVAGWISGSTARWKIALGHHPYRSNGPHGNAGAYDVTCLADACKPKCCTSPPGFPDGRHVKAFMDSFVCGKTDVYLGAHDHSLQWLVPTCGGTELIISGNGAAPTALDEKNPAYFQSLELGFLYVELTGKRFTGTFYGTKGDALFSRTLTK